MRTLLIAVALLLTGCPVGLGERCTSSEGCPSPLVCNEVEEGAGVGVCDYPLRLEGEPCSQAAECEVGLTCSNHFSAGERYGRCVPPRAAGEACLLDRDCAGGACEGASDDALGVCQ